MDFFCLFTAIYFAVVFFLAPPGPLALQCSSSVGVDFYTTTASSPCGFSLTKIYTPCVGLLSSAAPEATCAPSKGGQFPKPAIAIAPYCSRQPVFEARLQVQLPVE
jgi:hypothetical protein